jgi:hypothetical protein
VEGKPVAKLYVQFDPIGSETNLNPGPASIGETDAEGFFSLRTVPDEKTGAIVGNHRVRVLAGIKDLDEETILRNMLNKRKLKQLPPRFNDQTELTFEVPARGTSSADFDLSWK